MSNPWSKFFWQDWETDPGLKLCGYAAQGLWMRCLCIAASHDPIGYVSVAGRPLDSTAIAMMTGGTEPEVVVLLTELERNGVFSRDAKGRIYSRRMIRDAKKAAIAKKNGKLGGNPTLLNEKEKSRWDKGRDKAPVKGGDKPHKPEARDSSVPKGTGEGAADPQKEMFDRGVELLTASGHSDRSARSIIGKWRKAHGETAALDAIRACQCQSPPVSQPVEWIPAYLSRRADRPEEQQNLLDAMHRRYVTK